MIQQLVELANGRMEIMAGSGVMANNAQELMNTGIDAIHFTGTQVAEKVQLGMGVKYKVDEDKIASIMKFKH